MFGRSICVRWDVYTVSYIMCEQKFNEREDTYNFINPSTNKNSTSLTANKTTFIFYYTTVHLNDEWKNCHMFCGTKCVKSVSSVNKICKTYGKYLPFPPYFFFTWPGVNYSNSTNLQQLACQCMYMYVSGHNIWCSFYILVTNVQYIVTTFDDPVIPEIYLTFFFSRKIDHDSLTLPSMVNYFLQEINC